MISKGKKKAWLIMGLIYLGGAILEQIAIKAVDKKLGAEGVDGWAEKFDNEHLAEKTSANVEGQ